MKLPNRLNGLAHSVNFRTAERFGLLHIVVKPVVFWFEQYNEQKQNE